MTPLLRASLGPEAASQGPNSGLGFRNTGLQRGRHSLGATLSPDPSVLPSVVWKANIGWKPPHAVPGTRPRRKLGRVAVAGALPWSGDWRPSFRHGLRGDARSVIVWCLSAHSGRIRANYALFWRLHGPYEWENLGWPCLDLCTRRPRLGPPRVDVTFDHISGCAILSLGRPVHMVSSIGSACAVGSSCVLALPTFSRGMLCGCRHGCWDGVRSSGIDVMHVCCSTLASPSQEWIQLRNTFL